jgi:Icc-related predicted phosphoesterase
MGLFSRRPRIAGTRLFFATDIHGSEPCFRKFVNAGNFYRCELLILGGDMTGKQLVPITKGADDTYSCRLRDHRFEGIGWEGLAEIKRLIRIGGDYPVIGTRDELAELADPGCLERRFRKVVYDSVADWVTFADEYLGGTGQRVFVAPGNDDFLEIDGALEGSSVVEFVEERCVSLDEDHPMITTGYSNPTPWHTERELPEDALAAKLERMVTQVDDPSNLVAVIHPPPYDSHLDYAPELDSEMRVRMTGMGGIRMAPVGSTAVRSFIERHQPLLGLHGHVHEGGGRVAIGRTQCFNPGSEYSNGTLVGAIVTIARGDVVSHQFVNG